MSAYTLVCPFLNDDQTYSLGVEFGMLYARMQSEDRISDYFCRKNQEQILLAANRLGWRIVEIRPQSKDWFWCEMEKGAGPEIGPALDFPNREG